jgi:SpoVK/Ycf46/Vps4 family AAA+-type ATPase
MNRIKIALSMIFTMNICCLLASDSMYFSEKLTDSRSCLVQVTGPTQCPPASDHSKEIDKDLAKHVLAMGPSIVRETAQLLHNHEKIDAEHFPRQLVFAGRSGTGKLATALAIGNQAGLKTFVYPSCFIANQFANSGGQNIKRIFKKAEANQPCIVVIRYLDGIFERANPKSWNKDMWAALALELEEHRKSKIMFIGTLLNEKALDQEALKYFQSNIVRLTLPSSAKRKATLGYLLGAEKNGKADKSVDLDALTYKTAGFSYRCLENVVSGALFKAHVRNIRDKSKAKPTMKQDPTLIAKEDFDLAISNIKGAGEKISGKKKVSTVAKEYMPHMLGVALLVATVFAVSKK